VEQPGMKRLHPQNTNQNADALWASIVCLNGDVKWGERLHRFWKDKNSED
jgi:hypothetical protein